MLIVVSSTSPLLRGAQHRIVLYFLFKAPCHRQWNYLGYSVFTLLPISRAQLHVTVMPTFPLSCPTHVRRAIWKVASPMSWPSFLLAVSACLFTDSRWCESSDVSLSEITKKLIKDNRGFFEWIILAGISINDHVIKSQRTLLLCAGMIMLFANHVRGITKDLFLSHWGICRYVHFIFSKCLGDLGMRFLVIEKNCF